jgi:hypothetical protein
MMHAGISLDVDWRRQDVIAIGKVASVVSVFSNLLIDHDYMYTYWKLQRPNLGMVS